MTTREETNRAAARLERKAATMDEALWNQTVKNAVDGAVLKGEPTAGAFVTDINAEALANLKADGVDVDGNGWSPRTIELREGGE